MIITKEDLKDKAEFHSMFQVTEDIIFMVSYYTLGSNTFTNFTTQAAKLNKSKTDYTNCGQAQDNLLPKGSKARRFYEDWDKLHLHDLDETQYLAMIEDLYGLIERYNFEIYNNDKSDNIPFPFVIEFSKKTLKPKPKLKREKIETNNSMKM